jgi:Coenzyme PQQ synthesis protein D (PqqD)
MKLRTDGVTWRELDGETVILDLKSSKYLKTNATGTTLLKRLEQDCSRDELIAALADAHAVSLEQATADTDAFVKMLRARKLLVE